MHRRALKILNPLGKKSLSIATFSEIPPPSQNKPRGRGAGDGEAHEGDTG